MVKPMRRWLAAWPATLLFLALSACRGALSLPVAESAMAAPARPPCRDRGAETPEARASCEKEWSVLIYMMADYPGMTPAALWNLHQLEGRFADPNLSAASSSDADVIVQLDTEQPPGIRRLHVERGAAPFAPLRSLDDFSDPEVAHPSSPIVAWLDELHAEAPPHTPETSLSDFLAWGISRYPARHYAVIVWGHGFGFLPAGAGENCCDGQGPRGGIAPDMSRNAVLDIPALRSALLKTSSALLGGRPFDLYASDACLMQTVEVGVELAGAARYIAGAEAKLDPLGLPYRLLVPFLNGSMPPLPTPGCASDDAACRIAAVLPELARRGVDPQSELYASAETAASARENLTYSVLDGQVLLGRAAPALRLLGSALLDYLREAPYQEERKLALRDLLAPHRPTPARPYLYAFVGGSRDLGSFLLLLQNHLKTAGAMSPAAVALLRAVGEADAALRSAVVSNSLGSRYDDPAYAGMAGVSAWLPLHAEDYRVNGERFSTSRFYRPQEGVESAASPWRAWQQELFASPAP